MPYGKIKNKLVNLSSNWDKKSDLRLNYQITGPRLPYHISSAGFSITPYLESFTPTFGLGTPVFPRISSNLHCGTPTKRCLWDSYFQNPSENPASV